MKKILLTIPVLALIVSCSTVLPSVSFVSSVDYSEFTKTGFFITESNSVSFEYESLGSVSSFLMSGGKDGRGYTPFSQQDIERKQIDYTHEDAVRRIYERAIKMGGDGIINLKVSSSKMSITGVELPYNTQFTASGMVITRK